MRLPLPVVPKPALTQSFETAQALAKHLPCHLPLTMCRSRQKTPFASTRLGSWRSGSFTGRDTMGCLPTRRSRPSTAAPSASPGWLVGLCKQTTSVRQALPIVSIREEAAAEGVVI